LKDPARVYISLKKISEKYDFKGYALRCTPELIEYSYPCLAVSKLADESIDGACEGDLSSAVTMVILRYISGNIPVVFDCGSMDIRNNAFKLLHCGQIAKSLSESTKNISILEPSKERVRAMRRGVPGTASGAILASTVKPGRATLAKINRAGNRMFIATGETVEPKKVPLVGYAEMKMDSDIKSILLTMVENGIEHHLCLVHGDQKSELIALCDLLNIQPIVC
jgi:L-fucose isomerase-like protein